MGDLVAEHEPVEVPELLSMLGVVAPGEALLHNTASIKSNFNHLAIPVKLSDPNRQVELLPQQVHMVLHPGAIVKWSWS